MTRAAPNNSEVPMAGRPKEASMASTKTPQHIEKAAPEGGIDRADFAWHTATMDSMAASHPAPPVTSAACDGNGDFSGGAPSTAPSSPLTCFDSPKTSSNKSFDNKSFDCEICDISGPALPRAITRISNLVDPEEFASSKEGWQARSPSGNLLAMGEYMQHPERPLSLRERQERIKAALENAPPVPPLTMGHSENIVKSSPTLRRKASSRFAARLSEFSVKSKETTLPSAKRGFWRKLLCCFSSQN